MVDEPTTSTPTVAPDVNKANEALERGIALQSEYTQSTSTLGAITNGVNKVLGGFSDWLKEVGNKLEKNSQLTENGKLAFMGFGLAVVKAQESFKGFESMNMSHISTFGGHLKDLGDMLDFGGEAASLAKGKIAGLRETFTKAGGDGNVFDEALKKSAKSALGLVGNLLSAADAGIKYQAAQVAMAASTGTLGDLWTKAGSNLQNLGAWQADQNKMMELSQKATNSTSDQIQEYYYALGKIPGALQENIGGQSALTATIKLAHGTGMDMTQVVNDMRDSYKKFGLVGEDSLKFMARFSELSQDLHVELEDMRAGLIGATSGFSGMVDKGRAAGQMTEGVSRIMKEYVKGLQETGMNSKQAVEAAEHMTSAFKGLNVAQRAFLSAQTGGPGGLMGAARIERMLRSGDVEGVQKLVMQTLQKQTGKAVTLEEAEKSEAAAATRQKQIALLQQGPLAGLAKTPEDAGRLLEVMRAKQEGRAVPPEAQLRTGGLEKAIQAGSTWEKQTHTVVSDMAADVAGIRAELATMSAETVKGAVTSAGLGGRRVETLSPAEKRMRATLDEGMASATREGGTQAKQMKEDMSSTTGFKDRQAQYANQSVGALVKDAGAAVTTVQAIGSVAAKTVQNIVPSRDTTEADQRKALAMETEQRRSSTARQEMQKRMTPGGAAAPARRAFKLPDISTTVLDPTDPRFGESPAARVAAAPRGTPRARPAATAVPGGAAPEVSVTEAGSTGRIKVDVQVKVNEVSTNANAINPATGT